jgi:hypothetical protein
MTVRELDVVRVSVLKDSVRPVEGTDGRIRQPLVGDVGAVVSVLSPERVTVECVDAAGFTSWLADFDLDELELIDSER